MPFEIVRNDINNVQVDAIVNAASRYPRVNAGVDSAIHKKAGPALLEARKETGYIQPGGAAITPAFNLDAENVIHAATPTWTDGLHGESQLLRQAYDMCLGLAARSSTPRTSCRRRERPTTAKSPSIMWRNTMKPSFPLPSLILCRQNLPAGSRMVGTAE